MARVRAAFRTRTQEDRFRTTNVPCCLASTAPHHGTRPVLIAGDLPSYTLTRQPNQICRDLAEPSCEYADAIYGMYAAEPSGITIEQPAQVSVS